MRFSGGCQTPNAEGQRQTVLGLYFLPNTVADIINSSRADTAANGKAVVHHQYHAVSDAQEGFRRLVANAKKEGERRFDVNDEAVKRILKRSEDAARNVVPGVGVKIAGMSFLGSIFEDANSYAVCMILNPTSATGKGISVFLRSSRCKCVE